MPYLGQKPKDTFTASASQTITGTGATSYSLNQTVTSPEDIEVFINNVQQQPTVAYTVSGQTITFDEALLSTDSCYVVFRGARTESRTHPAASNLQAATINATTVGIATPNPQFPLQVGGNVDIIQAKGTGGNAFVRFTDSDSSSDFSIGADDNSGAGNGAFVLYDRVQSAYRMVVNTNGRVGINTTTPQVSPLTVHTDDGNQGIMITRHDPGSYASTTNTLGGIGWSGVNNGTDSLSAAEAKIVATAAEDHSGSTAGTDLDFYTKERGTAPGNAPDLNLRLRHSGKLIQYNRIGGSTTDNTVDDGHVRREVHFTGAGTGSSSQATISRDVHFQVEAGFNRYSYVFIRLGGGSYSRPSGFEYFLWSSTSHAAGSAGHHGACYMYNDHGTARTHIYRHKNFDSSYHNGSYYGWTSTPGIRFSTSTRTGTDAGIYCRIEGHGNHNGGTYNMGVVHSLLIRGIGSNNPTANNFTVYLVGHSSPGDIGSYVGVS